MSIVLPILPIEIVHKILIMREPHPLCLIIKNFIKYLDGIQIHLKGKDFTVKKALDFFSRNRKITNNFIDKRFNNFDFCWRFFKFFR